MHKYFLWTKNTHTYWVQHACVKCHHLSNSSVAGKRVGWFGKQTGVNTITYYRHAQWHSCAHTCTHTDTCILLNPQFKQRTGGLEHSKATVNNNFSFYTTSYCSLQHIHLNTIMHFLCHIHHSEQTYMTPSLKHNDAT